MDVEYPSSALPGPPTVRLTAPDDWAVLPDIAADVVLAEPPVQGFRTNVTVLVSRQPLGHELVAAAAALDTVVDALPEVQDVGRIALDQNGHEAYGREFVFRDPQAGVVAQHSRLVLVPRAADVAVVQVTGSASGERADVQLPVLRAIADSVRVDSAV